MRLELTIDGMLAVHARHAVFTALAAVEGLRGAEVELGRAVVEFDGVVSAGAEASGANPTGMEPASAPAAAQTARVQALREALSAAGFSLQRVRELPRQLPTLGEP
ncbi:MAG: hypothetical protein KF709_04655 [Gemmatimonadaceae bacterium]|nr:hypothetical protein [Gemmatimonadaceae bacterium]